MDETGSQNLPANNSSTVRGYDKWYSSEEVRVRDQERKNLEQPILQKGIGRRAMSWFAAHFRHNQVEEKKPVLTLVQGGGESSDIRSHRIITGPQGLKKTSNDVARSRIEGQEIPDNVLE